MGREYDVEVSEGSEWGTKQSLFVGDYLSSCQGSSVGFYLITNATVGLVCVQGAFVHVRVQHRPVE